MKVLIAITVSFVFLFCCGTSVSAWDDISPEDAQKMVREYPDAFILDVRTVCEYKFVGHPFVPPGKIKNIPYLKFEFDRATDEYFWIVNDFFDAEVYRHFAPTDILIVVCKSGVRAGWAADEIESPSQPASQRLEDMGFTNVYRMKDGFSDGWVPAGLPVSIGDEGIWKPSDFRGRSLK